jgi:hypothetical protein
MIDRRDFLHTTLAGAAGLVLTGPVSAAQRATAVGADRAVVVASIKPRHDATVRMLRD